MDLAPPDKAGEKTKPPLCKGREGGVEGLHEAPGSAVEDSTSPWPLLTKEGESFLQQAPKKRGPDKKCKRSHDLLTSLCGAVCYNIPIGN